KQRRRVDVRSLRPHLRIAPRDFIEHRPEKDHRGQDVGFVDESHLFSPLHRQPEGCMDYPFTPRPGDSHLISNFIAAAVKRIMPPGEEALRALTDDDEIDLARLVPL